jgi:hypothetical protein
MHLAATELTHALRQKVDQGLVDNFTVKGCRHLTSARVRCNVTAVETQATGDTYDCTATGLVDLRGRYTYTRIYGMQCQAVAPPPVTPPAPAPAPTPAPLRATPVA